MTEYRMLEEGEEIQEGDEVYNSYAWRWLRKPCSRGFVSHHTVGCYRRPIETKKGTGMFVEEVKTRKIKTVTDVRAPGGASVSLEGPDFSGAIRLVVGALWTHRGACYFNKETLTELIDSLTEVRDLMEGEG